MKVLLTGGSGQLGRALQTQIPMGVSLMAPDRRKLDLAEPTALEAAVHSLQPDWIINAGAYTAVDQAETQQELAWRINCAAPAALAQAARDIGAQLVQISTDFVFDGQSGTPYTPQDSPNPLNIYGQSKLDGELAIQNALGNQALIIRTAWVYAPGGHNFVNTLLRLLHEKHEVSVVDDQIGTPTNAFDLATTLWTMIASGFQGLWHWTDAGSASWYDFACAIRRQGIHQGLLTKNCGLITPIPSREFPQAARRPAFSVLDKTITWHQIKPADHWQEALAKSLTHWSEKSSPP